MDKETLSNYGWIVICVLVLAVMLALATPFGTFVADGFKATYTGLFETGDSALDVGLNAVGVKNTLECGHGRKESGDHSQKECGHYNCQDTDCGCVPASCGVEGHWSNDGKDHTTKVNHTSSSYETPHTYKCQCEDRIIPKGAIYTSKVAINGKNVHIEGDKLPCYVNISHNDKYEYGDYIYEFSGGTDNFWEVQNVKDKTKTQYEPILESIFGKKVKRLDGTFSGCTNLTTDGMPKIPDSVTNIGTNAFFQCTSLESITIPNSVTTINQFAFQGCTSLTNITLPESITSINQFVLQGCTSLASITIPSSVTTIGGYAFSNCKSLKSITFEGTMAQWNAITFVEEWNRNVPATEVICSDGTVSLS